MPSVLSVQSLYQNFEQVGNDGQYSVGLHPWYINNDTFDAKFRELEQAAKGDNVMAVGECGLDKVCDTDWDLQVRAFSKQVNLANRLRKPLVIHCVRAYEEVLGMLKDSAVNVPVIFHGFNKKWQLAEQILKQGYYLSFGAAILKEDAGAKDVFNKVPADKFFLETDDRDASIIDIYNAAASIRKTPPDALILQLRKNFATVFKR
ncbi:MAG: TatD family hydrolase [Bacteroidetes bacterium]|nr:TatD family hydrolase [Bacteroidota bacterium]